jgi:hypothetical protein
VRTDGQRLEATLAPASWNVIQLAVSELNLGTTSAHRRFASLDRLRPLFG